MIVLDASALLALVLDTGTADDLARIFRNKERVIAPHLIDIEFLQVLRRLSRGREITPERALTALNHMRLLPIQRMPHTALCQRIWDLRNNLTAYDAAYVALAEHLSVSLLTCDARLSRSTGHDAKIILLE